MSFYKVITRHIKYVDLLCVRTLWPTTHKTNTIPLYATIRRPSVVFARHRVSFRLARGFFAHPPGLWQLPPSPVYTVYSLWCLKQLHAPRSSGTRATPRTILHTTTGACRLHRAHDNMVRHLILYIYVHFTLCSIDVTLPPNTDNIFQVRPNIIGFLQEFKKINFSFTILGTFYMGNLQYYNKYPIPITNDWLDIDDTPTVKVRAYIILVAMIVSPKCSVCIVLVI